MNQKREHAPCFERPRAARTVRGAALCLLAAAAALTVIPACAPERDGTSPGAAVTEHAAPAVLVGPPRPGEPPPPFPPGARRWGRPTATFDPAIAATLGEKHATGPRADAILCGTRGRFMIDTGASRTVVSTDFAERAGLAVLPEGTFETSSDAILTSGRWCRELRFGPMTAGPLRFAEIRTRALHAVLGSDVDGMIGADVLRLAVVEFDFPRGTITIRDPALPVPGVAESDWVPVEWPSGQPAIRCRFEGDREGLFMIDTGSDGGVQFFARATRELDLLKDRKTSERMIRSVAGRTRAARGTLDWIDVAGRRLERVPTDFFLDDTRSTRMTGQIGRQALGRFVLVTDFGRRRLALREPG